MSEIWSGAEKGFAGPIGPDVSDDPPKVIIGGGADVAYRRAAEHDGWIMGGGPPEVFAESKPKLQAAWSAAGRDGKPYAGVLGYFALGPNAAQNAEQNIGGYYAWLGEYAQWRRGQRGQGRRDRAARTSRPSRTPAPTS